MKNFLIILIFICLIIFSILFLFKSCGRKAFNENHIKGWAETAASEKQQTDDTNKKDNKGDKGTGGANGKSGSGNFNSGTRSNGKWKNELSSLNYKKIEDSLKVIFDAKLVDGFEIEKISYDKYKIIQKQKNGCHVIEVRGTLEIRNEEGKRHNLRYVSKLEQLSGDIYILCDNINFEEIK